MKTAFTTGQLQILDTHPQRVEYYAAIHTPRIITHGILAALPNNFPGSQINITSVVAGYNLSVIKAGMTLRLGTESNKADLGTLRVREDYVSGSVIKVAEFGSGLVNWRTNACITVIEEYRAWPIHHSYDTATSRWLVDTKTYTSQLSQYGPQVIMGPPAVGTLDGGKVVIDYVGNLSYSHTAGASITSQSWLFPDGQTVTSALGSSAAPVTKTYINASHRGGYHTLTVTDGNGASHIGQRLTWVFGSGINQKPARVSFESITGGLKSGGYRTRFVMHDTAPSGILMDGAQVVIFERASYGTIASSVGGNYYSRDNIVMVGRVLNESMRIEPFTQELSFTLETIDSELRKSNAYDLFLEGASNASSWDMASNLTLDHAALALTKYRSTIANITDVHPALGAAKDNEIYYRSLPAGNLWEQLNYNYDAAFGIVATDLQGTIWAGLDTQVTGLSANLPNIMAVTKARRLEATTIEHEHVDTNAQYRLYAIQGGTASPLGAESPGQRQGYYGGKQEVTRNLLVADQETLITWSGNVRARENNPYKRVSTGLTGNIRLDSVPQSRVTMSVSAVDNRRQIAWEDQSFIPTETTINYNSQMYANSEIVMESIVNGMGGSSITFPSVPITPPAPPPPPTEPPIPGAGDGNVVYVASYARLGRSRNFLANSPTWQNVTGSLSGTILDFLLDPYNPANSAYALTSTGIYKTDNLNAATPTWTIKLTLATIRTEQGDATLQFRNLATTIAASGEIWVCLYNAGAGTSGTVSAVYTSNHFTSRNYVGIATAVTGQPARPDVQLQASNRSAGRAYAIGLVNSLVGKLYLSTDNNVSWASTYNFGITLQALEAAYAGSTETKELIIYVVGGSTFDLYRSTNGGTGFAKVLTQSGPLPPGRGRPLRIVNVATHNVNDVLFALPLIGIYDSVDGGTTWVLHASADETNALGRWPYNPNLVYILATSPTPHIKYSTDRGATFTNKDGNWASVMGVALADMVNIVPVWVAS